MRRRSRLPRYADAKFVITAVCAMLEMRTRNAERSVGNTGRYGCYCVQPYGSGPMRRSAIDPGAPVLEPPVSCN